MPQAIIKRLFDSLDELERSINLAKKALSAKEGNSTVTLQRVSYYEEVLGKQRKLARALVDYLLQENWAEVTRHIKLINGLSSLIHDDARAFVAELISGGRIPAETTQPTKI